MESTTAKNFRDNLSEMIDELIKSNEHLKVTTEMGNVVVLSESDYNGIMETLRIYSNPQEKEKNKTLSDWARESLLEKIEQEYDEKIVNEYLLNKDQMKFYSNDEVKKELGI